MRRIQLAIPAIAACVLSGGCASVSTQASLWGDDPGMVTWSIDESYAVGDTLAIGVGTENGSIEILRGGEGSEVSVRAEVRSLPEHEGNVMIGAEFDRATGALTLEPVWPDGRPARSPRSTESMAFTVTIPEGVSLERVSLSSGNGALTSTATGGEGEFVTGNGSIDVLGHVGSVEARSGNGAVSVRGCAGRARITTGNGAILLERPGGRAILEAGNGSIEVRCAGGLTADLDASTGHGTITVALAPGQNGRVEYSSAMGGVRVMGERVGRAVGPRTGSRDLGTGEGPTLRLRTTTGAIEVR